MASTEWDELRVPIRQFMFTIDQLASMLGCAESTVKKYLWFDGMSTGKPGPKRMKALNLADRGERPDWRVQEEEYIRYLRACGIRITYGGPRRNRLPPTERRPGDLDE